MLGCNMNDSSNSDGFYTSLPKRTSFAKLSDPASYAPLPDDWMIGVSDIVGSTSEVAAGRYKTVNMVGAAVISAQINSAQGRSFPFVFGGDGAGFACPPDRAASAGAALAAVRRWAGEEFDMSLRVALVPIGDIRAAGLDVAVARYQPSPGVDYAMFSGGGLSWAEARMKTGAFAIPEAQAGTTPDLTGLSCRWSNVRARNGSILSVVIQPVKSPSGPDFARLTEAIITIARQLDRGGHPVPQEGAITRWPPPGLTLEAHASRGSVPMARQKRKLLFVTLVNWFFLRWKIPINGFDPAHYTVTVGRNADFRKFDDGLKMTLDCDKATQQRLREVLVQAQQDGIIRYGLCEQDEAMMTCIVPSILSDDHVHFIDGAAGGYTQAAARIKGP
jgi:Protein of unknown function (DUF3095)